MVFIYVFIYLKSTTEGPEGHLYCRKNTETHKKTKNKQTNEITQKILQISIQYTVLIFTT